MRKTGIDEIFGLCQLGKPVFFNFNFKINGGLSQGFIVLATLPTHLHMIAVRCIILLLSIYCNYPNITGRPSA